jgi:uncharacterized protein with FMN-binding domain
MRRETLIEIAIFIVIFSMIVGLIGLMTLDFGGGEAAETGSGQETQNQETQEASEPEEPENGELYVGYSEAPKGDGYVEARVVLDGEEITSVELIEYNGKGQQKGESYSYDAWHDAVDTLPGRFTEANNADIEIVSGATQTSEKAIEAVEMALAKAEGDSQFEGTFMGVSDKSDYGYQAVVWATIEGGEITDLRLEELSEGSFKDSSYDYEAFHEAKSTIKEEMLDQGTYEVDTYSGATGSSNRFMTAVERAFEKAGWE